jgi:nucleoid-associated protein YgaU
LNANPQIGKRPRFFLEVGETILIPPRAELDKSLPKSVFPEQLPADYIVMPGDSLHFIAQNVYGNRELWPLIYEANRSVLSERVKQDTRQLIAGQVLRIPSREAPSATETAESSTGDSGAVEQQGNSLAEPPEP